MRPTACSKLTIRNSPNHHCVVCMHVLSYPHAVNEAGPITRVERPIHLTLNAPHDVSKNNGKYQQQKKCCDRFWILH
jgi:hypothetical protein